MTQDPGRSNNTPKLLRLKSHLYISKLRAHHALRHLAAVSYNPGICNDEGWVERSTYAMRVRRNLVSVNGWFGRDDRRGRNTPGETIVTDGWWEFETMSQGSRGRNRPRPQRLTGDALVGLGLVINGAH
jgi:hypothetical protein